MAYSREHLSQWVDFFDYNPATRHRRRILVELLSGLRFESILEVGCGDGNLLRFLKRRFPCRAYGLDCDDSPAAARGGLDGFYRLDVSRTVPDVSADVVIASEMLEHVEDEAAALRNIRSACRGHLLLTVPGGPIRATDRYMGHLRHYRIEGLASLVERSGFRVRQSFAWGFPFHSIYKALQDLVPGAMLRGFGSGAYGPGQKAVCGLLTALFYLNLRRGGYQLFLLADIR